MYVLVCKNLHEVLFLYTISSSKKICDCVLNIHNHHTSTEHIYCIFEFNNSEIKEFAIKKILLKKRDNA